MNDSNLYLERVNELSSTSNNAQKGPMNCNSAEVEEPVYEVIWDTRASTARICESYLGSDTLLLDIHCLRDMRFNFGDNIRYNYAHYYGDGRNLVQLARLMGFYMKATAALQVSNDERGEYFFIRSGREGIAVKIYKLNSFNCDIATSLIERFQNTADKIQRKWHELNRENRLYGFFGPKIGDYTGLELTLTDEEKSMIKDLISCLEIVYLNDM